MRSSENYDLLIGKINTFIRKYYFNSFLRGLIFLGAGLFSAYVVITLSEYFGNFNTTFRTFLFYFFITVHCINRCFKLEKVVKNGIQHLNIWHSSHIFKLIFKEIVFAVANCRCGNTTFSSWFAMSIVSIITNQFYLY